MKCFECLKSRTDSPDNVKTQPASALPSAASPETKQTVIGVQRDGGGVAKPKRQAKFAHLEEVLKSKKGMEALREYMTKTDVEQLNMLDFLEDLARYRSEADDTARAKSAQTIFTSYLKVCADKEVSLDGPVRDDVFSKLSDAPPQLFDAAEKAVVEDIRRDVFPRFLKTPMFERLAGLA